MDLKNISTEDLINELKDRKEVDVYVSGLYRKFEAQIKKKYTNNREFVKLPDFYTLIVIDEDEKVRKIHVEDGIMRRFRFVTDDESKKDKFNELVYSKNLSRDDLVLILTTINLNLDIFPQGLLEKYLGS
ncbi:hypothetical protein KQI42_15775 [Tissierella sp. MSJ-40]|uniref:Uncharacterized protein n=1 Tax=Tissierella simiarum TaxID=2841534 RepID=A0ABS6E9N5_9FIRM|nr:hypothetical protein [Tissierella simiarum]MBU5439474.1 hypothetical protein [Tissierella simiarum]